MIVAEKTELEKTLEAYRLLNESSLDYGLEGIFSLFFNRLIEVTEQNEFLSVQDQEDNAILVYVHLGKKSVGSISMQHDRFQEMIDITAELKTPFRHSERYRIVGNYDELAVVRPNPNSRDHELIKSEHVANSKFVDLLCTKLLQKIMESAKSESVEI